MFGVGEKPQKVQVETRSERVIVLLKPSEVAVIDGWAEKNKLRSRGDVMRRLIGKGLMADGVDLPNG